MKLESTYKVADIRTFLIAYFLLLAIVIKPLTYEGKNALFIGIAIIGIFVILFSAERFPLNVDSSFYWLPASLVISFAINVNQSKFTSFVYSLFFLFTFLVYVSFTKAEINKRTFYKMALCLLFLYLSILLIGQLYVILGFFPRSLPTSGIIHDRFGTLFEGGRGFRYYSLSTEPSYAAFVVITLLYVITELSEKALFHKRNVIVWIASFYMLASFQSGYGVLLFFILLMFKLNSKNFLVVLFTLVSGGILAFFIKQPAAERVVNLISNLDLSNIVTLAEVDYSASFRVLPIYYYIKDISFLDCHFFLGHGAGQSSKFLIPLLFHGPEDGYEGGFLPQFLYDYGILFGLLFVIFVRREVLKRWVSFETIVILFMLTNANFNTQLFWFIITCFALNKWYSKPINELVVHKQLGERQA